MVRGTRLPRRLGGPLAIGICAPSGAINPEALTRAVDHLQAKGHRVVVAPQTFHQWRYFAGADEERIDAFHQMLADPAIDVLMAARGGSGWTWLLDKLDFSAVAASDKAI